MLCSHLKALRLERNMSQQAVASALNMSRQVYNNYELGKRQASHEVLHQFATLFNVSTDYLLGRTDDPTPPGQKEKPAEEIQWGDFSYALYKESPDLSEEDRDEILDVVRLMVQKKKERQQKEKSSE